MVKQSTETVTSAAAVPSFKSENNYVKLEEKAFATHPEAVAKVDEWRKEHKIPKKESIDNLHKVRIRLRSNGQFDAVLYQKKTPPKA